MPVVAPAFTTVDAALASPLSLASIVQLGSPSAVAETVRSWAVSLLKVRLNENEVSDEPVRVGVVVGRLQSRAALALTVILMGRTSVAPPPVPVTRIVLVA